MEIEKIKITDIKPAEYNPRQISSDELTKLTNSINEFGLVDPIIINLRNNKIIGGHQRYEVLINQYMLDNNFYAELNMIRLGDIGWIFTDTDLKVEDEDHEKALNLALNKISGEWDTEKLGTILEELEINDFNIKLTGFDNLNDLNNLNDNDYSFENKNKDEENTIVKYGTNTDIPYYEITGEKPKLNELYNDTKYNELIENINNSNIDEEIKKFLKIASLRHIVFDYSKIAEYYAHADKELQELMEDNALVIIDINKAIKNGFVEYNKQLNELLEEDYGEEFNF